MSNKPNKKTNADIPILSEVGTLSKDTTWVQMRDYKTQPFQGFNDSRTRNGVLIKDGHRSTDFSKPGTSIGLGSEITSMTNGEARRYAYTKNFHDKNGKLLPPDYAVVVTGTGVDGKKYKVTYGHLTEESTRGYPTGERDVPSKTVPVKVGTTLGKVSDNSLARNDRGQPKAIAHHVHMKVEVWGKDPKTGKTGFYPIDALKFIQAQDAVYQRQSGAEVNEPKPSSNNKPVVESSNIHGLQPTATSPSGAVETVSDGKALTIELRKIITLAMEGHKDQSLDTMANTLLKYNIPEDIATMALIDDQLQHDQSSSPKEAFEKVTGAINLAMTNLQAESNVAQTPLKRQAELIA